MKLPLYRTRATAPRVLASDGHTGLWFDKFFDGWDDDWQLGGKLDSITSIAGDPSHPRLCGSAALLDEATMRQVRLITAREGRFGIFLAESRFVTGLGRSHPIENGFAWHSALGVPYLPGSSLKGVTLSWAREGGASKTRIDALFGSTQLSGRVAFADALPIAPVYLDADVLTPHFAGWSASDPPGDWRSPTPVPFLVMRSQAHFLFSLLPCGRIANEEIEAAWSLIVECLAFAGVGAKTAVGYGRFSLDEVRTRKFADRLREETVLRREQSERQRLERTPEGRWTLALRGLNEEQVLDRVRINFEKEPLTDSNEASGLARAVEARGFLVSWRLGKTVEQRTNIGSRKLKERAALVDRALADSSE